MLMVVVLCIAYGFGRAPSPSVRAAAAPVLALTKPMGWNSWDSYGLTITESEYKANAEWMAKHLNCLLYTSDAADE